MESRKTVLSMTDCSLSVSVKNGQNQSKIFRGRGRARILARTDQSITSKQEKLQQPTSSHVNYNQFDDKYENVDSVSTSNQSLRRESCSHETTGIITVIESSEHDRTKSFDKENSVSSKPLRSRKAHFDACVLSRINKQLQQSGVERCRASENVRRSEEQKKDSPYSSPTFSVSPSSRLSRVAAATPKLHLAIPASVEKTSPAQKLLAQGSAGQRPRSHTDPLAPPSLSVGQAVHKEDRDNRQPRRLGRGKPRSKITENISPGGQHAALQSSKWAEREQPEYGQFDPVNGGPRHEFPTAAGSSTGLLQRSSLCHHQPDSQSTSESGQWCKSNRVPVIHKSEEMANNVIHQTDTPRATNPNKKITVGPENFINGSVSLEVEEIFADADIKVSDHESYLDHDRAVVLSSKVKDSFLNKEKELRQNNAAKATEASSTSQSLKIAMPAQAKKSETEAGSADVDIMDLLSPNHQFILDWAAAMETPTPDTSTDSAPDWTSSGH